MQREEFKSWLINNYNEGLGMGANSAESRVSNAQKIEETFGDLDAHYRQDQLKSVLELIKYSTKDKLNKNPLPKGLKIDGNWYNGLSTLRQAIKKYIKFKSESGK